MPAAANQACPRQGRSELPPLCDRLHPNADSSREHNTSAILLVNKNFSEVEAESSDLANPLPECLPQSSCVRRLRRNNVIVGGTGHKAPDGGVARDRPSAPAPLHVPNRLANAPLHERLILDADAVLGLQRSVGNAGVTAYLSELVAAPEMPIQREAAPAAAVASPATQLPDWSDAELDTIQRELRRLGLYKLRIDHIFGGGTQSALVEAFGGDEWRKLRPPEIIERLRTAPTPARGKKHEHRLRYGEMFKDGILDMTVGLGFTEETVPAGGKDVPYYQLLIPQFEKVLVEDRGFKKDHALAETVVQKAGREVGPAGVGDFYVLKYALTYTPPAAETKSVDVVVRLLASGGGASGGAVAAAFTEGMVESDVAYYTGHGRYGSGSAGRGCSVDSSTKGIVTMTRCSPYRPLSAHQFRLGRCLTSG